MFLKFDRETPVFPIDLSSINKLGKHDADETKIKKLK